MKKKLKTAYLGLGSNIGDRRLMIDAALQLLNECPQIDLIDVSQLIESQAISSDPQPDYLNGACAIKTTFSAVELLKITQHIESQLGRTSKRDGAARCIDIDILLLGDIVIASSELTIPHPKMGIRDFVLTPLMEIAASVIHPVYNVSIQELARSTEITRDERYRV